MRFQSAHAKKTLSLTLSGVLLLGAVLPGASAADITPACDETYYATLDAYGGLVESSVVKSYRTYGSGTIVDYGAYEQVTNLSNDLVPSIENGKVSFSLTGDVPDRFYFEGKTDKPYKDFPWDISLSYKLNGVPTPAEKLAGGKGVVEITLDAVPSKKASEYSRNNLVLTAMSVFNGDDVLSLEAPGAQVQLVGNLYCVLYAALPGEEQHFTISVGTEDFTYDGMMLLAVPATLEQLEQVADLREVKDKTEESYDAITDSLDAILDSLEGMGGSLEAAASGLDQLNTARSSVSGGKGQVYDELDAALAATEALSDALAPLTGRALPAPETEEAAGEAEGEPAEGQEAEAPAEDAFPGHLPTAQQAVTDLNALLNEVSGGVSALRPEVEESRRILQNIQSDLAELQERLNDEDTKSKDLGRLSEDLSKELKDLESSLDKLSRALGNTRSISKVSGVDVSGSISIQGMTPAQIKGYLRQAEQAHSQYEANRDALAAAGITSFSAFLQAPAPYGAGLDAGTAAQLETLYNRRDEINEQLKQLDTANAAVDDVIGGVNDRLDEVNEMIDDLAQPAGTVCRDLTGVVSTLAELADLMADITGDETDLSESVTTLQDAAALTLRLSGSVEDAIGHTEELTEILNTYEPSLQQAITDSVTVVDGAAQALTQVSSALRSAKDLLQTTGPSLDSGTRQSLSGISDALRKASGSTGNTQAVRDALDVVEGLIDDEWNTHTGETNNILLMDASAPPESMTDSRNGSTASIQYVMRTQEIKEAEAEGTAPQEQAQAESSTFWSRILTMLTDIWAAIVSFFHRGSGN